MSDEAKLGLVAGVLAVLATAVFGFPHGPAAAPLPPAAVTGSPAAPPGLPPAAVVVPPK